MRDIRNISLTKCICAICLSAFSMMANIGWAEASERGRLRPDRDTGVLTTPYPKSGSLKSDEVTRVSSLQTVTNLNVLETDPPELCAGHGTLNSISLTEWTSGLGSWTVGTHDIANPDTFDTPDWIVTVVLPDDRSGKAAFVSNIDSGDCWLDDESGALTLDSPPIPIPAGTLVPRVSVDHWVATEFGYDGGNIKISVNGGAFNLIPASAIDFSPYNSTLITTIDGSTNPLAGEAAFTGTDSGGLTGSWGQSQMTLFGIAAAGDSIQLRFDFGVDGCDGLIGWYVDDVEVYSCSDELPPSDCGNAVLDNGEQCDDGNRKNLDGCSSICKIERCGDGISQPGEECSRHHHIDLYFRRLPAGWRNPLCLPGSSECSYAWVCQIAAGIFWPCKKACTAWHSVR